MCKQPAIRAPFNGFDPPYFWRQAIKPGISFSAKMISLRPHSANEISAIGWQKIIVLTNLKKHFYNLENIGGTCDAARSFYQYYCEAINRIKMQLMKFWTYQLCLAIESFFMNLTVVNRLYENEFSAKISTEHLSTLDGDKRVNRQLNAQSLYLWIWQWDVILDLCTLSAITGSRLRLFMAMKLINVLTNCFRDCYIDKIDHWMNHNLLFFDDTYSCWIAENPILNSELKLR